MSVDSDESGDKEHDASAQRLVEARKKGDIPRSADLLTAVASGGFLLALSSLGGWAIFRAGTSAMILLDQPDRLARLMTAGASAPLGGLLLSVAGPPMVLLLVPPVLLLAFVVATRSFVFTPERILPRLSRISPLAAAKQRFGSEGLVEFAKGALKLCIVSTILATFLASRFAEIMATIYLTPGASTAFLSGLTIDFLLLIILATLALGGVDYLWQVHLHRKRNRMSRKEMMDEFKESEGDPHFKAARRQRAQEVATNRMLADVERADVVVVNPTHYAVALRWERGKGGAPICVAKGIDEIARVIRERADEHGVPIHSDPPCARALYATVELGQEIRSDHYRAVAAAIRFADAMRRKAGKK